MSIQQEVQAVIDGIRAGRILQTFEQYYAEDVVMSENGERQREGKAVNRAYQKALVHRLEIHAAEVLSQLIDGDRAAIEWELDVTPNGGARTKRRQVALQTWRDGKVVREDFFHADPVPRAAAAAG